MSDELAAVLEVFPNALFGTDNEGQLIIYTNVRVLTSADNPTIPEGEVLLIPFEEPNATGV